MHFKVFRVTLVGEQLRRAREAKGLSVPDIVGMTNLMTEQVLRLESGDWQDFAAPVYVRGFVRSYAGVLKIDVETLLAQLDEEMGQNSREKDGSMGDAQLRSGIIDSLMLYFSHVKWRAVTPILLLIGLMIGIYYGGRLLGDYKSKDNLEGLGTGLNTEPDITDVDRLSLEPSS